ncbi:MAG: hypothetical protein D8M28_00710 [Proteobacteria bacterium]|nr:hypothetical protein [Pseudomonadota bacterium]
MIIARYNALATQLIVLAMVTICLPNYALAQGSNISNQILVTFAKAALLKEISLYQRVNIRGQDLTVHSQSPKYTKDNYEEAQKQYQYAIMPERLTRWSSSFPLNVRVVGKPPNYLPGHGDVVKALKKAIPRFEDATGLSFTTLEEGHYDISISLPSGWTDTHRRNELKFAPNALDSHPSYFMNEVTVYFRLMQLLPSHTKNRSILTNSIIFAPKHGIHKGICEITKSGMNHIEEAVQECLLTSLGLTNLFTLEKWDFEENLTLLSILYSPKLKPGMSQQEIMSAFGYTPENSP